MALALVTSVTRPCVKAANAATSEPGAKPGIGVAGVSLLP